VAGIGDGDDDDGGKDRLAVVDGEHDRVAQRTGVPTA
jgi:hypothetical protein